MHQVLVAQTLVRGTEHNFIKPQDQYTLLIVYRGQHHVACGMWRCIQVLGQS